VDEPHFASTCVHDSAALTCPLWRLTADYNAAERIPMIVTSLGGATPFMAGLGAAVWAAAKKVGLALEEEDIAHCPVCLERYLPTPPESGRPDRRPVAFACGHGVCASCASNVRALFSSPAAACIIGAKCCAATPPCSLHSEPSCGVYSAAGLLRDHGSMPCRSSFSSVACGVRGQRVREFCQSLLTTWHATSCAWSGRRRVSP
jgi:hypothetical protein